jgi:K+-sensing histidine kinase KdpD
LREQAVTSCSAAKTLIVKASKAWFPDINEQAVWLTTLVENMLSKIRIDSGKLEIRRKSR